MKLPHWYKAFNGATAGISMFSMQDCEAYSMEQINGIIATHSQYMVGLYNLQEFSTRDYAYDRGGMQIREKELIEFSLQEWPRS